MKPESSRNSSFYSYYPGCSLHATGLEYGLSAKAVFNRLGLNLVELSGWNCCGASSAHALDHFLSLALPARNLALAQETGHDLAVPCAACFNRIKNVIHVLEHDPAQRDEVQREVGFQYNGQTAVRHLLGILYEDYGCKHLADNVLQPLQGLKVATYYGCLLLRPAQVVQFDDPDHPTIMAQLLRSTGAEVVAWSDATECCGGSLSLARSDIVYRLVGRLVERAREAGAQSLVTACPLCQVNLEMRQRGKDKMPAFYFTELLGLALGLPEAKRWWGKHLVDPRPLLSGIGLLKMGAPYGVHA
jgi:heterodisulfide reductase subunit B2